MNILLFDLENGSKTLGGKEAIQKDIEDTINELIKESKETQDRNIKIKKKNKTNY